MKGLHGNSEVGSLWEKFLVMILGQLVAVTSREGLVFLES